MAKTETKNIDLQQSIEIPKKLPLLPIRDIVVFPYMVLPLFVGREMSIKAIEIALESNRMIFLTSQKDINVENPSPSDLYSVGTVGVIMRMLKLPDGRIKILVQGVSRAKTVKFLQKEPFYQVEIKTFPDASTPVTLEIEALMRNVKATTIADTLSQGTYSAPVRVKVAGSGDLSVPISSPVAGRWRNANDLRPYWCSSLRPHYSGDRSSKPVPR